jgi:hypothetical protein
VGMVRQGQTARGVEGGRASAGEMIAAAGVRRLRAR